MGGGGVLNTPGRTVGRGGLTEGDMGGRGKDAFWRKILSS